MKKYCKLFIICASIFSFMIFPKISQCQWANPTYGGYYNYGQPQYPYGGQYGGYTAYAGNPPWWMGPAYLYSPQSGFDPYLYTQGFGYYPSVGYNYPNYGGYYQSQTYDFGWNQPNYGWNSYNNMYQYDQNPWVYGYYINQSFPYNSYPALNPWAPIPAGSILYIQERGQIVFPDGTSRYLDPYIDMVSHTY